MFGCGPIIRQSDSTEVLEVRARKEMLRWARDDAAALESIEDVIARAEAYMHYVLEGK